MPCEPQSVEDSDPNLFPAVMLTWGTEGVAKHPGETFDAGSGYFITPEYVVTASHIGDWIRQTLQVRTRVMKHVVSVHDPRSGISWRVSDERPIVNSDIAVLRVEPIYSAGNIFPHLRWKFAFRSPLHRASELTPGEILTIKGFTSIGGELIEDNRREGGKQRIYVSAEGQTGEGTVSKRHANGYLTLKHSCVEIEGIRVRGNTSGGPVLDQRGRIVGVVSTSPDSEELGCHTLITDWHPMIRHCPLIESQRVGNIALNLELHDASTWQVTMRVDETRHNQ